MIKKLLLITLFLQSCLGYIIRGYLDEKVIPLSDEDLSSTIELFSDSKNGELPFQKTYLRQSDGHFSFSNVTEGNYLLVLNSVTLTTGRERLKITLTKEKITVNKVFDGHDWTTDVGPLVDYPIVISPIKRQDYVQAKESFGIFGMLKSPMNLLMLGSVLLVFLLPKLMESIGMYIFV